jgi:2-oxoglutarate dehydrogenase E2 component (dihydrolipoamide succinyltransferase)
MPTDVKMPQMGESIYEGTVTKWLKKEGDLVRKDEPLYEISTDKVDTEIPSPVTGRLVKILVAVGSKVPIHTVVAQVEEGAGGAAAAPAPAPRQAGGRVEGPAPKVEAPKPAPVAVAVAAAPEVVKAGTGRFVAEEDVGVFASPLVRKIAKEEGIDLRAVKGTGIQGRITKEDIMRVLAERKGEAPAISAPPATAPAPVAAPPARPATAAAVPAAAAARPSGDGRVEVVPMTPMRAKIADHMVMSRRTSAHVTTVFEADLSRIVAIREKEKDDYERVYGTKLTFTPFFATAAIQAIKDWPIVNASVEGNTIVYKHFVNLGMAVALPDGLIVPVVKNAEEKSFLGLCRAINDLAERARTKKLSIDDVQGGTFTITNPGIFGGMFGTPIINQPQVAILGIGGIEKRPVVVNDAIAIRPMCYVVLSFDHRVIDGAVADQFMAKVKQVLQEWTLPIK